MERTKRISMQTLAIAVLSVLLVATLLMSATGAWFTSDLADNDPGYNLGTIELGDIGAAFDFTLGEGSGDVFMPGDVIDVSFNILNEGSADMWVRFKLAIVGDSLFEAASSTLAPLGYVYNDNDQYFYRTAVLEDETALEPIAFELTIPLTLADDYQGDEISFQLNVETVQAANNGTTPNAEPETGYSATDYQAAYWDGAEVNWGE